MKLFIFALIIVEILYGESKLEKEIKQKLISPCCWAGTIYDLDHNPEIELEIKNFISQGKNKDFILDYYVSIYGERILAVPKAIGFNLFIWITPIIFAMIGITFLLKYLLPYSKDEKSIFSGTKDIIQHDEKIEKELRHLD
tara:strand:- start:1019 stop:1441 length:423 start_codon:yes stop_codon:yes gene_type:complete